MAKRKLTCSEWSGNPKFKEYDEAHAKNIVVLNRKNRLKGNTKIIWDYYKEPKEESEDNAKTGTKRSTRTRKGKTEAITDK